jgi:hypothetical protein
MVVVVVVVVVVSRRQPAVQNHYSMVHEGLLSSDTLA